MRVATFEKCGQSRFDIAETLVNELLSEIDGLQCKGTQLENGFLWLFLSINYEFHVEFSCLATDCRLTQHLGGVSGVLHISGAELVELEEQWLGLQSWLPPITADKYNFSQAEALILQLTASSFRTLPILITRHSAITRSFLRTFWPGLPQFAYIDLSSIEILLNMDFPATLQDSVLLLKSLNKH